MVLCPPWFSGMGRRDGDRTFSPYTEMNGDGTGPARGTSTRARVGRRSGRCHRGGRAWRSEPAFVSIGLAMSRWDLPGTLYWDSHEALARRLRANGRRFREFDILGHPLTLDITDMSVAGRYFTGSRTNRSSRR